jgi:hypothetical protein
MTVSVFLVILPLVALPSPNRTAYSIAAGSCAAVSILLLAYPFAILDHYRIEFGATRGEKPQARHKGEPVGRILVVTAGIVVTLIFAAIIFV